jgi:Fic family protein
MPRPYEQSHPWLTFNLKQINDMGPRSWLLMGEARSKCQHLAGAPLHPALAEELNRVTLIKGAQATTAIEGNTLTEAQVAGLLDGTHAAPPSRHYQEVEVRNLLDALGAIDAEVQGGKYPRLTVDLIRDYNSKVLHGLDDQLNDGAVPGELREHSVVVGPYRGAPADDYEFLLQRLCEWLEGPDFKNEDASIDFSLMLVRAMMAHLYLAWIHPFGDGNGRTARLVEFLILARSGKVPLPAAHLLSSHYNLTCDQYYRELDRASKTSSIVDFVAYATEGFVDGIRDEIDTVRQQQLGVAWINYVNEVMGRYPSGKAADRQRELVLAMSTLGWLTQDEIKLITPAVAQTYARAGDRMVPRDLNRLIEAGLARKRRGTKATYQACVDRMAAFMAPMHRPQNRMATDDASPIRRP